MLDPNKKLFRWGPLDAALLPLSYTLVSSFDSMFELFKACWPESLVIFDHDKALWILESEKVASTSNDFTEKIILSGKEDHFYDLWDKRVNDLSAIHNKINESKLSELNNQDLGGLFSNWSKVYLDFWAVGMTAELINYGLEYKLKALLRPKYHDERDFNEAFATLTTPTVLSFYKQEEIDLMQIVLAGNNELGLKEHQEKYHWIYNNYLETRILDSGYFADQIKHTTEADAKKFLQEFSEYEIQVEKAKKQLVSKLNLTKAEIDIVESLNRSIVFQDNRKKYNLLANYYLECFLEEFGQRQGVSVRDLKWLLPNEIAKVAYGEDMKQLIEERKNITVIQCDHSSMIIETRNKASKTQQVFDQAEFEKSANLQGTVACTSKNRYFRGVARIIHSPKAGDKLQPGEILVTTMTTPDFVVFMKRAGAIITDFGGVTCHAAIVSRELGTPCIVGTENATAVIKDGDILELHNLRGTIKITSPQ